MAASPQDSHKDIISHHDKVLIVDFGSQVTQLIARRVRDVRCRLRLLPLRQFWRAF